MSGGWDESAQAWIADQGDTGDWSRRHVLDAPMLARVRAAAPANALDVGCGEGRFCRMLRAEGVATVGIDPTEAFIDQARRLDPAGDYRLGWAEKLDVPDAAFDLVISYLTLIDIPQIAPAIAEMTRALRPGGRLLIANLNSFNSAGLGLSGLTDQGFAMDHYLEERAVWSEWRGIRVQNWHRPLSAYMTLLLDQGLTLTHFAEPSPIGAKPTDAERYNRAPWFMMMEWRRPA